MNHNDAKKSALDLLEDSNHMEKKSPGRPSKLSRETKDKLLGVIKLGLPYSSAAAISGIGERTFHRWKEKGEKAKSGEYWQFWQELKKAEEIGKASLITDIRKDDSWQAKAWILERRWPKEYGRQMIDHNHAGKIEIEIIVPEIEEESDAED